MSFINEDFMLSNQTARELYHESAEKMPIIDYHCHLVPQMIAENYQFKDLTEVWLGGDHYKWRAMRGNGVPEEYITGDRPSYEKFEKWAATMPYAMRNPLYHWTHLELRTAFGITKLLNPDTAREIYDECNEKLQLPEFSARGLMRRYGVEVVCTTDDPVDSLEYHKSIRESGFEIKVLPTWRPDKAMAVEDAPRFRDYVKKLATVCGREIVTFDDFLEALQDRHEFFASMGCRLSDHGLEEFYDQRVSDPKEINVIFEKVCLGNDLKTVEIRQFKTFMLFFFAMLDDQKGWTQQFHYGPIRNTNTRLFESYGADVGCDSIGEVNNAKEMAHFFDRLDHKGQLAKTIVYNLNPAANAMVATMIGNFQDGSIPGKMQWGSGWWFLDQKGGIEAQLNTLSEQGLLSRFVGMLTDSRSFLSYPRHEYFRRILCNLIGRDVENGELPIAEMPRICQMVEDICYYNAKRYFEF